MNRPVYLFAGGGTGGHLAPGIAVAAAILARSPDARIVFVGAGRAIEQRMLSETGFERMAVSAQPWSGIRRQPIQFLQGSAAAIRSAREMLRELGPDCVIGLGGYASVPMLVAAGLSRSPVILMEQNVLPGRANRLFAYWFPICISFERSRHWLPVRADVHVTGNPLRQSLLDSCSIGHALRQQNRTILITGGSQGSSFLNQAVTSACIRLGRQLSGWNIVHQTGDVDCHAIRDRYCQAGLTSTVEPFFDDLPQRYARAAFVVCRAGATTLTELACAGLPGILVPFRHSSEQHQVENALVFGEAGAAKLVRERDLASTSAELEQALAELLGSPALLDRMSQRMQSLARPEAASAIADLVLSTAAKRSDKPLLPQC